MKRLENNVLDNCNDVITVPEMSRILNISKQHAYKLVKSKEIPYIQLGMNYRVLKSDLISYINDNYITK